MANKVLTELDRINRMFATMVMKKTDYQERTDIKDREKPRLIGSVYPTKEIQKQINQYLFK